jgi:hypothetical protein
MRGLWPPLLSEELGWSVGLPSYILPAWPVPTLFSMRPELRRARMWAPLLEYTDLPASLGGPFTALSLTAGAPSPVSTSFTMVLLEQALAHRWRRSLSGVRIWLWQHRRQLGPLFTHPDRMPQRVLWVALCHLWRVPELEGPINQLLERVIDPLCRRLIPILRAHLGDLAEDIASEIRTILLESTLQDPHPVKVVVPYLRESVLNKLRDRIKMAKAASRPALVSITPDPDDPDAAGSFDEALSGSNPSEGCIAASAGAPQP